MNKPLTRNQVIFNSASPWDNPYQGNDKKVLFVCSAGILRSATAQRVYGWKYNTLRAGSEDYALVPVSSDLLLWANEVVFVNEENYRSVCKRFDLDTFKCQVKVLNIPDQYDHMNPALVEEFSLQYEEVDAVLMARLFNKANNYE